MTRVKALTERTIADRFQEVKDEETVWKVMAGEAPGRRSESEITIFFGPGLGLRLPLWGTKSFKGLGSKKWDAWYPATGL